MGGQRDLTSVGSKENRNESESEDEGDSGEQKKRKIETGGISRDSFLSTTITITIKLSTFSSDPGYK